MTAWMERPLSYLLLQQRQASSANTVQCVCVNMSYCLKPAAASLQTLSICAVLWHTEEVARSNQFQHLIVTQINCLSSFFPQRPVRINFKGNHRATIICPVSHHTKNLMKHLRIPYELTLR